MTLLGRFGIEYSGRDFVRRMALPVTVTFLLASVFGLGTNPDSDIPARGKQVAGHALYDSKMHTSQLEKEAEEFGLYVNKKLYGPGITGLYTYEGEPPKYLDLEFRLGVGRAIMDIIMEVDGQRLSVAHTKEGGKIVGHSRYSDFTRKGEYDVCFKVVYGDGDEKEIFVKVRKENEKKNY